MPVNSKCTSHKWLIYVYYWTILYYSTSFGLETMRFDENQIYTNAHLTSIHSVVVYFAFIIRAICQNLMTWILDILIIICLIIRKIFLSQMNDWINLTKQRSSRCISLLYPRTEKDTLYTVYNKEPLLRRSMWSQPKYTKQWKFSEKGLWISHNDTGFTLYQISSQSMVRAIEVENKRSKDIIKKSRTVFRWPLVQIISLFEKTLLV